MVSCEVCGWKDDAEPGSVTRCPCCGNPLAGAAALAAALQPPPDEAPAWGDPDPTARPRTRRRRSVAASADAPIGQGRPHSARGAIALVAAAVLGLAAIAAFRGRASRVAADSSASAVAVRVIIPESPEEAAPPAETVRRELLPYLPQGFELAGDPIPTSDADAGMVEYRVPLRARSTGERFRVPVTDLHLPPGSPALLRELAHRVVVDPRLAPGKEYDLDARQPVRSAGSTVEARWRASWSRTADGWRLASAVPVRPPASAMDAGPGAALLTADEVAAAGARRTAALDAYAGRCRQVEAEVARYRQEALARVPPGCASNAAPLLRDVVRLSAECPRAPEGDARAKCYARRELLNRQLGECQEQDQEHERALAAAEEDAAALRRRRVAALTAELERGAGASRAPGEDQ